MSFFAMPSIMHISGRFKMVHRNLSLFSITPYLCIILKRSLIGPYIRALRKKDIPMSLSQEGCNKKDTNVLPF